ncbi:MAG: hypothetical protein ACLUE2_14545 [Bacteroides cellulosilyticus]
MNWLRFRDSFAYYAAFVGLINIHRLTETTRAKERIGERAEHCPQVADELAPQHLPSFPGEEDA